MELIDRYATLMDKITRTDAREQFSQLLSDQVRAGGSLSRWMKEHDGGVVHTIQAGWTESGRLIKAWSPLSRTIDARSNHVRLDGSRRDYPGVHTIAGTDHAILCTDTREDLPNIIAYVIADPDA